MITALLPAFLVGPSAATAAWTPAPVDEIDVVHAHPELFVEGEPFEATVEVTCSGETPVEAPLWVWTVAAFEVDGDALAPRPEGSLTIQPGQTIRTTIDLSAAITGREDFEPADFDLAFADSGDDPVRVTWLGAAERGIDFMELPANQLGDYQVVFQTTSGTIWIDLWPDVAPNHVRNFLDLSYTGFYDGSPFHRVIPGFMIQGGKASDGSPAPRKLDAEFSTRRHVPGVLSAARLGNDVNSATSEFFLMHEASPHLDGQYTAYGKIVSGQEVVNAIVQKVEQNYTLVRELSRAAPLNPQHPVVAAAMNTPYPDQRIEKAIVVKAAESR